MTLRPALLAVLIVLCASLGAAPQAPSRSFVHASRAALRVQPSRTALVVGYLTTNTEVEVQTRTGEWCGVRVAAVSAPGFIACSLLGDNRLTLEEIDARILTFGENVRAHGVEDQVPDDARRLTAVRRIEDGADRASDEQLEFGDRGVGRAFRSTGTGRRHGSAMGGSGKLDKVTIESVDIDRDTVPDFSIWSGLTPSEIQDNVDLFWKAVYANVQGQWVLLTYHQSADCT